jgi:alkylhydroperoxidase family enzyme
VLDSELQRVTIGPDAEGWSAAETAALRATDELINRHTLSGATWADLTAHFTTKQILDLLFLVGQYQLVASALNALRIERDDGLAADEVPFPTPVE